MLHRLYRHSPLCALLPCFALISGVTAQIVTSQNDNSRTGANTHETILTGKRQHTAVWESIHAASGRQRLRAAAVCSPGLDSGQGISQRPDCRYGERQRLRVRCRRRNGPAAVAREFPQVRWRSFDRSIHRRFLPVHTAGNRDHSNAGDRPGQRRRFMFWPEPVKAVVFLPRRTIRKNCTRCL